MIIGPFIVLGQMLTWAVKFYAWVFKTAYQGATEFARLVRAFRNRPEAKHAAPTLEDYFPSQGREGNPHAS